MRKRYVLKRVAAFLGGVATVWKFGRWIWGMTGLSLDAAGVRAAIAGALDLLAWGPVYFVLTVLLGVWVAEFVDAALYRREGCPRDRGAMHFRRRTRWTIRILGSRLYFNDHRRLRELERTNRMLGVRGFAEFDGTAIDPDTEEARIAGRYLELLLCTIGQVGMRRAADESGQLMDLVRKTR